MGVLSALIRAYLSIFVWLVSDRGHARSEHQLILWSIQDAYLRAKTEGHRPSAALTTAIISHLSELAPWALYQKTLSDQLSAERGAGHLQLGRLVTVGSVILMMIGLAWSAAAGLFDPAEGLHLVAQAQAEHEGQTGTPIVSGPYRSQEEAMAAASFKFPGDLTPGSNRADGYGTDTGLAATSDPRPEPKRHCLVRLAPLDPGTRESVATAPRCFETLEAVVLEAIGVSARFDAGAPAQALTAILSRPSQSRAIGVSFAEPRYLKGGTIIWIADNALGCTTGLSYAIGAMPADWDDVLSSSIALGGCDTFTHFELSRFAGTRIECTCDAMVAMDGLTSSLSWSR